MIANHINNDENDKEHLICNHALGEIRGLYFENK